MIVIARLQSEKSPDAVWDYILENHATMNERLQGEVRLLYATRRARYKDVSLFMHINSIEVMGEFIAEEIAKIEEVDNVWIVNLINPRFFPVPQGTLPDLSRFTITIMGYLKHLKGIYEALCATPPTPELAVMYVGYTFHHYHESIMVSVLAENQKALNQFIAKKIKKLPGVFDTHSFGIQKTHRLLAREEWQNFTSNFPEDWA